MFALNIKIGYRIAVLIAYFLMVSYYCSFCYGKGTVLSKEKFLDVVDLHPYGFVSLFCCFMYSEVGLSFFRCSL